MATHTPVPAPVPELEPEEFPEVSETASSDASSSLALGSSKASEDSSPSDAIDLKLVPLSTNINIEKYVPSFLNNFIFDDPLIN
jgi:hypothetical protein